MDANRKGLPRRADLGLGVRSTVTLMRSGRWIVLSSLMIVTLAACGGGVSSEWRSTDQSKPPAVIVTHPPTNGSDEAEVNGRVRYLRTPGCFVLVQGRGEERVRFLIVWPHGSAVRDERGQLVVDVPGFGDVPEGSSIEAGGGYSKDYARLSLPRPPDGCVEPDHREFVYPQGIESVTS